LCRGYHNLDSRNVFGFALGSEYGAYQATAHLVAPGATGEIVFIAGPRISAVQAPAVGISEGAPRGGIKFAELLSSTATSMK
jgi:DNA-binding LacI/PurR family transcriptional regulator